MKSKKEKLKKKSTKKLILKINKSKGFKDLNKLKKNFIIKLIDLHPIIDISTIDNNIHYYMYIIFESHKKLLFLIKKNKRIKYNKILWDWFQIYAI